MKITKLITILWFIAVTAGILSAQVTEDWVSVETKGIDKVYYNKADVKTTESGDYFVWVETMHQIPVVIESVREDIYKTRTHYLVNDKLNKYSMLEVIYYNEQNKKITGFKYQNPALDNSLKYNFPIIPGSDLEAVLAVCKKAN